MRMPRSVKGVRRTVVWETKRETVGDRQAPSAATLIPCPGMSGLRGTETKIRKSAAIGRPTGMPSQTVGRRRGRCTAARTSLRSENPMCCARARFRSHSIAHAAHVTRCGATWSISDARSVHVVMTSPAVAACDRRAVVNEPCRQERPRSQQRRSARVPRSHTAAPSRAVGRGADRWPHKCGTETRGLRPLLGVGRIPDDAQCTRHGGVLRMKWRSRLCSQPCAGAPSSSRCSSPVAAEGGVGTGCITIGSGRDNVAGTRLGRTDRASQRDWPTRRLYLTTRWFERRAAHE